METLLKDKYSINLDNVAINKDLAQALCLPSCSMCGQCCTDVLMASPAEVSRIKKYIKVHNIKPINRNTIFDKEQKNVCPFLRYDNSCAIYPVRLEMCQRFYCEGEKRSNGLKSYKHVNVISMMQTFFPDEFMTESPFDLTYERVRLKNWQRKIYE